MSELVKTSNSAVEKMSILQSGVGLYSSISPESMDDKKKIYSAISDAKSIRDFLDTPIALANVISQAVSLADEKTGEVTDAVRVILISADGDAFAATSDGIMASLRDLFGIFGEPNTWTEPIPVMVKEFAGKGAHRFFKVVLA